jgi:hypothetical protein
VISNAREKDIISPVILKPVNNGTNSNHIIRLGHISDWDRDLNIIEEVCPV